MDQIDTGSPELDQWRRTLEYNKQVVTMMRMGRHTVIRVNSAKETTVQQIIGILDKCAIPYSLLENPTTGNTELFSVADPLIINGFLDVPPPEVPIIAHVEVTQITPYDWND